MHRTHSSTESDITLPVTFQEFSKKIVGLKRLVTSDIAKIYGIVSKSSNTDPTTYDTEFRRLCDNTKKLVVLVRDNFAVKEELNEAQTLVVSATKQVLKLILRFSQAVKKGPVDKPEIDSLYDQIFENTKDLVAAINVILKGKLYCYCCDLMQSYRHQLQ